MDPSPQELKLTPDLLEYARAVALKEAPNHCGRRVDYEDVAQEAILHLLSRPPKFDPSRGGEKTLIYTIVKRAVIRFADREAKQARKFRPFPQAIGAAQDAEDHDPPENQISESRTKVLTRSRWNMDDILKYIDNEESRNLCRLVIECKGNISDAARSRLGVLPVRGPTQRLQEERAGRNHPLRHDAAVRHDLHGPETMELPRSITGKRDADSDRLEIRQR